ncbi:nucleotidyl transferase AbiEii/AbiGii toxin family protein [Kitasatospora phosalacinea]|uniref:Nucleotidyl transferase AbiEii/AbiGii toxin family protein n=1 Tax=Kitasatospora phosalacinea TaxID=2065 RepID=A0A9W6PMH0_9ACTN|nr:nucleotidyl transferase AbiEii/AbiGii toxin family protein [Kitasatospora phosalacinea]GLW57574.1 hypothetical protein Kpho01_55850 [Kitasatospora phosalacinea]
MTDAANAPDAADLARRVPAELPLTFRPVADPRARQLAVFDPSLKQHAHAYRAADPRFADPALATAWRTARRTATDAVLSAVAASRWADHLVLRGSVVLRAWFGAAAREPGDLDFVLTPADWAPEDPRTAELFADLTGAVPTDGAVRFLPAEAVSEEIWTYDRVPGLRLLLPWEADGLPGGGVQVDFVFHEHLPLEPDLLEVAPGAVLQVADRELSLAWKLIWLVSDAYPQGKDLYDAVLLAESVPLRRPVLTAALTAMREPEEYADGPIGAEALENYRSADWRTFADEHPQLAADPADLVRRLDAALAPTFAEAPSPGLPHHRLLELADRVRDLHDRQGMAAAQQWLSRRPVPFGQAHRVTERALDRPDSRLAREMLACPAWHHLARRVADGTWTRQQLRSLPF